MVRFCYRALVIWLSLLVLAAPSWSQNLVVNGGFETGNFASWNTFGSNNFSGITTGESSSGGFPAITPPEGNRYAYFGPLSQAGIFQNFTTVIGQIYRVSYYLNAGRSNNSTRTFNAQIGNPAGTLTTLESLTNPSLFAFALRTFTFTAVSTTTQIRFTFENDPEYWRLDGVVVRNTVPELNGSGTRLPLFFLLGLVLVFRTRRPVVLG